MWQATLRRSAELSSTTSPGLRKRSAATSTARCEGARAPQAPVHFLLGLQCPCHSTMSLTSWEPPCSQMLFQGGQRVVGVVLSLTSNTVTCSCSDFSKDPAAQAGAGAVTGGAQHLGGLQMSTQALPAPLCPPMGGGELD